MFLVAFHYFINPLLFLLLYRLVLGKIFSYDFKSVFLGAFFLLNYVQALNVYWNYEGTFEFLFMCWVVPYLFLFGYVTVRFIGQNIGAACTFKQINTSPLDRRLFQMRYVGVGYIFLVTIVYIFDKGFENVNLFYILSDNVDEQKAQFLRVEGLKSNYATVLSALYGYTRALFLPLMLGFYTYLYSLKKMSLALYVTLLFTSGFYCLLTGAKAPVAYLILTCTLVFAICNKNFTFKKQVFFVFSALFIPSLVYPLISGSEGVDIIFDAIENLWRRVTWVNSYVASLYVSYFDGKPVGFSSYNLVTSLFDMEYFSVSAYLYDQTTPVTATPGGTIDGSFFASYYAENSWLGFILGTIFTGMLLSCIELYLFTRKMDGAGVVCLSFCLIGCAQLTMTGLNNIVIGRGLVLVPLMLFVIDYVFRKINKRLNNEKLL